MEISRKIILLGKYGVGKTALINRFVYQKFADEYTSTIGVRIDRKKIVVDDVSLSLLVWDIAGESTQRNVPASYKLGAHGILYVVDVSRPASFADVGTEVEELRSLLPNAPIVVLGNKVDLLAEKKLALPHMDVDLPITLFTSAKSGENVETAFYKLGEQLI